MSYITSLFVGTLHTYSFGSNVTSVQLLLKTNGCPLNTRIELLQGPNTNKEVVELSSRQDTF